MTIKYLADDSVVVTSGWRVAWRIAAGAAVALGVVGAPQAAQVKVTPGVAARAP